MSRDDSEDDVDLEETNLVGLVVAFYEMSYRRDTTKVTRPEDYFCIGHVTDASMLSYDDVSIRDPIKVTSLDGKEYRYFGKTKGDVYQLLLEDPFKSSLVVYTRRPAYDFDVISR